MLQSCRLNRYGMKKLQLLGRRDCWFHCGILPARRSIVAEIVLFDARRTWHKAMPWTWSGSGARRGNNYPRRRCRRWQVPDCYYYCGVPEPGCFTNEFLAGIVLLSGSIPAGREKVPMPLSSQPAIGRCAQLRAV